MLYLSMTDNKIYDRQNKLETSGICAKANLTSVFIAEIIWK